MQDEVISLPLTCCDWFKSLSTTITWRWEGPGGRDEFSAKLLFYIWWLAQASCLSCLCKHICREWVCVAMGTCSLHTSSFDPGGERWAKVCGPRFHGSQYCLAIFYFQFEKLTNFQPTEMSLPWAFTQLKGSPWLTSQFFLQRPLRKKPCAAS